MTVYNIYFVQWANRMSAPRAGSWISDVAGYSKKNNESIFTNYGDEHVITHRACLSAETVVFGPEH